MPKTALRKPPGSARCCGPWPRRALYLATSSRKYEGWLGSVYTPSRYETRGKFSKAKFGKGCLAEYAETFPVVCGDFAFYQIPTPDCWPKLFGETPGSLLFGFNVPEDVQTFEPSRQVQEPYEVARAGLVTIATEAIGRKKPAFLFVNNRLEGHAPTTIEAVATGLLGSSRDSYGLDNYPVFLCVAARVCRKQASFSAWWRSRWRIRRLR